MNIIPRNKLMAEALRLSFRDSILLDHLVFRKNVSRDIVLKYIALQQNRTFSIRDNEGNSLVRKKDILAEKEGRCILYRLNKSTIEKVFFNNQDELIIHLYLLSVDRDKAVRCFTEELIEEFVDSAQLSVATCYDKDFVYDEKCCYDRKGRLSFSVRSEGAWDQRVWKLYDGNKDGVVCARHDKQFMDDLVYKNQPTLMISRIDEEGKMSYEYNMVSDSNGKLIGYYLNYDNIEAYNGFDGRILTFSSNMYGNRVIYDMDSNLEEMQTITNNAPGLANITYSTFDYDYEDGDLKALTIRAGYNFIETNGRNRTRISTITEYDFVNMTSEITHPTN